MLCFWRGIRNVVPYFTASNGKLVPGCNSVRGPSSATGLTNGRSLASRGFVACCCFQERYHVLSVANFRTFLYPIATGGTLRWSGDRNSTVHKESLHPPPEICPLAPTHRAPNSSQGTGKSTSMPEIRLPPLLVRWSAVKQDTKQRECT